MGYRPRPIRARALRQLQRHRIGAPRQMTLAEAALAAVTADPELHRLALESAALIARAVARRTPASG